MLRLALIFLAIGIVAALLGFTGVAGASFAIAKVFALIFGVLFLVFLLLGMTAASRIASP
ncbi:MAG TPA: DUF1328 family protein [Thermoanaerobaculia bacterium]|jgi:uncharacterized membrane protein YtjA (UPF0391 family)|nr:DUF1328 family protein [Thermoanaerobaculia bacterium]